VDLTPLLAALQPRSARPLHQQLEAGLRDLIRSGQVRPGAVIPGELELATQLGVSRHTVRHALGVLSTEGLLRRERGRGTTVVSDGSPPPIYERSLTNFYAFAWEVRARGAKQRSYILERTTLQADEAMAERLRLAVGTPIEGIIRVRTADEEPLVLETAHLPQALVAALSSDALEREAIYDTLEQLHGFRILHAHEVIRPVTLPRAVARLLRVATGSPAFSVERTTWSSVGPIEWQTSLVRGDRYLYSIDLPRAQ